jgi:hypothetical protein
MPKIEIALRGLIINLVKATEDRVFENKEAKASQGGTTENERKYSILGSIKKIVNNTG